MLKRFFIVLMIVLILFVSGYGCSNLSATEKYLKALANMSELDSYESNGALNIDFDLSEASDEDKEKLKDIKNISLNNDIKYYKGNLIENMFFDSSDVILDSTMYVFNDKVYLKSTFLDDKYIDLNAHPEKEPSGSENLTNEIYDIWVDSVKAEIMEVEGNSIITTPDGDIKVKQVSLSLSGEKSKKVLKKIIELIEEDENIREMILNNIKNYSEDNEVEDELNEFFENFDKFEDKFEITKLNLTAKYDKDNYILEQEFEGEIIIKNEGKIGINFNYDEKFWNLNKEIELKFPDISEDDIMDTEDMKNSDFINDLKDGKKN